MIYQLIYTKNYNKKAGKFLKKYLHRRNQYEKTLELLELNPYYPSLRLHQLQDALKDLQSISINMNYRSTIEFLITDKKIILVNVSVSDHTQVY